MNSDQIGGLVRTLIIFVGGIAVAKGWANDATVAWVAGGAATLAATAWSIWTNRPGVNIPHA
jgi:hypothetical protein